MMDYAELKKEIRDIANIASSVPEDFRVKCFEILLNKFLAGREGTGGPGEEEQKDITKTAKGKVEERIPLTTQLRVFMKKTSVTQEELSRILVYAEGDVHFTREPSDVPVSNGQIQWALLLALKNGILNDSFCVDPEDVRSICQEKGFYDRPNFASIFKYKKNAKLFKKALEPQGDAQQLSNEGLAELAKLTKALAGHAE